MDGLQRDWMHYLDAEVRAACDQKGWGSQVRRKWSARERPVNESPLTDYEWKLIPSERGRLPERAPSPMIDEGRYYVLSVDAERTRLVLQHDTIRTEPFLGVAWFVDSFTEIRLGGLGDLAYALDAEQRAGQAQSGALPPLPLQRGVLRDLLIELTSRYGPNLFSIT